MLEVKELSVGYPRPAMVREVSLVVGAGEKVALLGSNGAGKSTFLRGVMGLAHRLAGTVAVDGATVAARSRALVEAEVAYVPEGRHVFPAMTVEENLRVSTLAARKPKPRAAELVAEMLETFDVLARMRNRRAGALSGGQQQLLAVARALVQEPRFLLIDEPSLGLSPVAVDVVYDHLRAAAERDVGVLLVEQNVELALELCDRGYFLQAGELVASGTTAALSAQGGVRELYFGVG